VTAYDPLVRPISFAVVGRGGSQPIPGRATPGVATIVGADSVVVLDAQQGAGTTGAPIRFRGRELIKFKLILKFWESGHWQAWDSMRALFQTPPFGKLPAPLTIWHPWLVMQEVSQVVVKGCSQPVLDDYMAATVTIDMWEYKKPRVSFATVKAEPDKPLSPIDAQLKAARETLERQNQNLAAKRNPR
jgi:hypothetical protein